MTRGGGTGWPPRAFRVKTGGREGPLRTVNANGIDLNVTEIGHGPPLVMLHGLLIGNIATWYFTCARALAGRHRVVLYDLRGHGRSARPTEGYDVSTMADDLAALAEALELESFDLVGHSWGGLIALDYARRYARVRRLATVEAPLAISESDALWSILSLDSEEMATELLAALPETLRRDFDPQRRRGRLRLEALAALAGETSLLDDLAERRPPTDEALGAIRCPVLSVYGAHSPCLGSADRLARALPAVRTVTLDGGHFLPLEAPEALGKVLMEFFDG